MREAIGAILKYDWLVKQLLSYIYQLKTNINVIVLTKTLSLIWAEPIYVKSFLKSREIKNSFKKNSDLLETLFIKTTVNQNTAAIIGLYKTRQSPDKILILQFNNQCNPLKNNKNTKNKK